MDEYTFKHCPKGHYYQGDECPYCNTAPLFTGDEVEDSTGHLSKMKICPHGHAYNIQLNHCPYCGETRMVGYWDMCTARLCSIWISLDKDTIVQVDGKPIFLSSPIEITCLEHQYRTGFRICGTPPFNHESVIQIGRAAFSGKEFINMVEFIMNTKEIKIG